MVPEYILFPITGFLIGWLTNYLAIHFLFWPRNKVLGIQGIIPKRRKALARKIGEHSMHIMPEWFQAARAIPKYGAKLEELFKMSVEKRINSLSNDELEKMVKGTVHKEFLFLEIAGGIIGALIGTLQLFLI